MEASARPAGPAAPPRQIPGPLELLWRWLNSLPIAIVVMLLLAFLSALGTLIPQAHLEAQPGVPFIETLTIKYGEPRAQLIQLLGLDRVYFTWYFNALLIWLAVSAVICNIVRYRRTVQLYKSPAVRRGARFFMADRRSVLYAAEPQDREVTGPALATVTPQRAIEALADDLRSRGYRVRREDTEGAYCLYADRGFLQKWALVLLHFAVLVLLFGGMYGRAVGNEGTIRLGDGQQSTLVLDATENKYEWVQPALKLLPELSFELDQHSFRIDYSEKILLEERLQQNVAPELQPYYRYFVKDYISDLSVEHGGKTKRQELKVNHPLVINKLNLYQSGYDQRGYLAITVDGATAEYRQPESYFAQQWHALTPDGVVIRDETGRWFTPREQGETVFKDFVQPGTPVSSFAFTLEQVKAGKLFRHNEEVGEIGPLTIATLADSSTGRQIGSLLLTPDEGFETLVGDQVATVRMAERVDNYSVFAYKRDPGIPVLYFGWVAMITGIALTMYIGFTQVWARAEPGRLRLLALGAEGRSGRVRRRVDALLGVND